jgi:hypothetical protein
MRMPDREACARQLDAGLARASGGACLALLHLLGQVGGARALETLKSAVKKGEPSVRDAALHILSEWQDVTAAPELLALARTSDNRTHKVLALRGYIRLIGQRDLPPDRKLVMCREALPLIERPEEKQLLLGALGGVHSAGGLALVAPYLDDPVLNEEASAAAVAIGERLAGSQPAQVSQLMKKVLAVVHNQDIRHRAQEVLQKTEKK